MDVLFSPVILFFLLGALAAFARSDLSIPEPLSKALSLYLMCAIGLKGGILVAENGFTAEMFLAAGAGLLLSVLIPVMAFGILKSFGKLDRTNAAAVAAHYGSVSVVTFITGNQILTGLDMAPAGYMIAVLALMETPAIIVGLYLARRGTETGAQPKGDLLRETLLNGSVVLLTGSFIIGLIIGKEGFEPISPVFQTGFTGLLCLFLLDMGLLAARRLRHAQTLTLRLVSLGVAFPAFNGLLGCVIGAALGFDAGTTTALALLAASASYIAVPAAIRMALPKADAGLYLAMSLAITFPFNIIIGIPLFTSISLFMVQLWS
ncbi:sodium-dependent bicarbonate transport family permease [Sneathiella sp. P13V-1]|uniref:sodium-dependent bicarbonate transport family permease n=1 Tax=Sneathiella sp. P13V-1 TaxID=2697366 RepID=UPI00187B570B|nr:sodium-dependent bicarbonate transport family permease [Sneathiella sp. P13V-1]MBE7638235.1 sodium-dependent bicarbonate transport family permease [Sneathiella sp. P13V-1]